MVVKVSIGAEKEKVNKNLLYYDKFILQNNPLHISAMKCYEVDQMEYNI